MLVVTRFRYDETQSGQAQIDLGTCVDAFAERPGYLSGTVGRAVDDPTLWVLATTWENVGAYRRALSAYDIKMHVVPVLSHAIDEPSAYEVIVGAGSVEPNEAKPRGSG
jgi:hypothetical protein